MFKIFLHSQLLKPIFCSQTVVKLNRQKFFHFKIDILYHSVISPFAVQLFLVPFSSHCSTENISLSDSGYIMKPL